MTAPWTVVDGFGGSMRSISRVARPRTVEELAQSLVQTRAAGQTVTLRGAGRSYGDAALHAGGLVLDTRRLDRVLSWDPERGILEAEPGLSIEGLWRHCIADGWWPQVVPGTMVPTLGGCLAANVHGKNSFKVGPFGASVLDFDLLLANGELRRCSRVENTPLFHAAIGGLGLLGAVTRLRLQLQRVFSGRMQVQAWAGGDLGALLDRFHQQEAAQDHLVGWVDGMPGARSGGRSHSGRGIVHGARQLSAQEDPQGQAALDPRSQLLRRRIAGLPVDRVGQLLRLFAHDPGVRTVNSLKYHGASASRPYLQSHAAFAFLLDVVPDWRRAYGREGLVQVQVFLPRDQALEGFREILRLTAEAGRPPWLCVLKRHAADDSLLCYALDGFSLALDFPFSPALYALGRRLTERVLDRGGRFYLAKDALLQAPDVRRMYGSDRLDRFLALKAEVDPGGLFTSDLARRVMYGGGAVEGPAGPRGWRAARAR